MIVLTLEQGGAVVGGELRSDGPAGPEPPPVEAMGVDSRRLPRRALFVALRGHQADGHAFLEQARANGAVAALVEAAAAPGLPGAPRPAAAAAAQSPPGPPSLAVAPPPPALPRPAARDRRPPHGR